ncbi:MAG TPA: flagellar hook capping FlgD N-terminal domain-containing protein [Solirubrobacteraceae bacterium]|jgi:flagellar basal-body rod modification protein FlgD|nr:flagellar hook capping FlgD N-terminal domain-containing protein [Solirubrobacteraceae bacterium]
MSTSTQATAAAASSAAQASAEAPENPGAQLGKNDFLKLMVAQLQAQNPLEPTSDTEYVAELAQFSQLEQTSNLAQTTASAAGEQRIAQAVALIGHKVSFLSPATGATVEGEVQNAEISASGATLTVAGEAGIEPSQITEVA